MRSWQRAGLIGMQLAGWIVSTWPRAGEAESESLTLNKHGAAPGHPAF